MTVGGSNQFQGFSKSDKYIGKNEVDKFMKLLNSQQGPLIICDSTMHTKGRCRAGIEPVAGAVILPTWIEGFQVGIASFRGLSLSDSNGVMKSVVRLLLRKTDLRSAAVVPMEMSVNAKEGKYSCHDLPEYLANVACLPHLSELWAMACSLLLKSRRI